VGKDDDGSIYVSRLAIGLLRPPRPAVPMPQMKLKASEWKSVGQQIEKCKTDRKPVSDLMIQGIYVHRDKIKRGIAPHYVQPTLEMIQEVQKEYAANVELLAFLESSRDQSMHPVAEFRSLEWVTKMSPWVEFQRLIRNQIKTNTLGTH
jgi:hypothetical protein